jgi:hypothetical protein
VLVPIVRSSLALHLESNFAMASNLTTLVVTFAVERMASENIATVASLAFTSNLVGFE